ncbi:MAG TPA: histidine kinase [Solirubrobacteraceae bacterium]|nr:histidine kinase [Solirubrobacteraceae bacterium]
MPPGQTRKPRWRVAARSAAKQGAIPLHTQLLVLGLLGALGAAWVGEEAGKSPSVSPTHVAVLPRVTIIVALVLSGLFAYASRRQRRMGRLLIIAGLFSCAWLLNGSREEAAFTVGLVASGLLPGAFCYLMLAFPTGRVESRPERRFVITTTTVVALAWLLGVLSYRQPIVHAPFLHSPQAGANALYLGLQGPHQLLTTVVRAGWLIVAAGTALLVARRARRSNRHSRVLLWPMVAIAAVQALLFAAFLAADAAGAGVAPAIGTAYLATLAALPLAIFLGLAMQRLSLGGVLARFVTGLGSRSADDMQAAMARTLNDPELKIFYRRTTSTAMLDSDGIELPRLQRDGRRRALVHGGGRTIAVVEFDASLSEQEEYIQATATSAVLWLEKERLATELAASKGSLEASRARLARAADAERLRIQRDLHDGAQQHLIGMHMKLEVAVETMEEAPARSAALLAEIGEELGQTAEDLRSLAANVYPPSLREYGLLDALRSAIRRMGADVRVEAHGVNRHPREVETQLYFVCLEALQNMVKHGGPGVTATLRMWESKRWLLVELRDAGVGFDPERVDSGSGLRNMQDRLHTIGGHLTVRPGVDSGTLIWAVVPIRRTAEDRSDQSPLEALQATGEAQIARGRSRLRSPTPSSRRHAQLT